jgi:hypothetical protein
MENHKEEKINLDEFHYHEFMDRSSLMMYMVNSALTEHPLYYENEEIKKMVDEISDKIFDLYQHSANLRFKDFKKELNGDKSEN